MNAPAQFNSQRTPRKRKTLRRVLIDTLCEGFHDWVAPEEDFAHAAISLLNETNLHSRQADAILFLPDARFCGLVADMKLFEKQDDQGVNRRSKTKKQLRRMKHKRERAAAKRDPEHASTYGVYRGWVL